MKAKETSYQQFEKDTEKQFSLLLKEYNVKIDLAQDEFKLNAHNIFWQKIIEDEQNIQRILGNNSHFFSDIKYALQANKYKDFESEFNSKFEALQSSNKIELLQQLALYHAHCTLIDYLRKEGGKYKLLTQNLDAKQPSNFHWTGKTELEFVQLIYSLYEAKYLTNNENQITNLVPQIAKAFNYEIGKNWQSNLSDNINNRNTDYQPEIFDKLKTAFSDYRDKRIDNNKKKKPK